jgi:hypothetical protein
MATLTYKQPVIGGTDPAFAAAAGGGDKVLPNDRGYLHVRNGSGAPITVTVLTPGNDKYGQARPDIAVSVPATTGERIIGPFPADLADPADGLVAITYSGVTSLTVTAITL